MQRQKEIFKDTKERRHDPFWFSHKITSRVLISQIDATRQKKYFLNVEGKITIVTNLFSNYHLRIKRNESILCHIKREFASYSLFLKELLT